MIAGTNRNSVFVEDARQIVGMDAIEIERNQPDAIITLGRAVRFDIRSGR